MITPLEIVIRNLRPAVPFAVVSKVPSKRPDLFVRVDMGAPQKINLIQYRTLIIVQAYGNDSGQVLDTLFHLQTHLEVMDMKDPLVSGWDEEAGPVEFPDPDIPHVHRWQMTGILYSTTE